MDEDEVKQLLEYIPQKERDSYDAADFAGPDRSFPITSQAQLDAAAHLIGHAADPAAVKRKAIAIAKRKGFTLPDAWKKDGDDGKKQESYAYLDTHIPSKEKYLDASDLRPKKWRPDELPYDYSFIADQESAATITSSITKPRQKIATLRVCFLEYNARSLNGRIYPKATCDRIYESATRKLADTSSLPITVFVSHEAANGNANTELVGAARRIWQENTKFYADLDLADTRTAWDMLALAEGGYLRSESMRVLGVELVHDRNHDLPLVVPQEGVEPELLGIDLTTRPGLMDTARIQQVLYESQAQAPFTEAFTLDNVTIESRLTQPEKGPPMPIPIYMQVLLEHSDPQAHQKIHDHLAGVMDATVAAKHGTESARLIAAVEAELGEEGKAIAKQHAVRLAKAHDIAAHHAGGMECEGCYNDSLGIALDPDQDGDIHVGSPPDDQNKTQESRTQEARHSQKGNTSMALTEQQIQEALTEAAKRGYTVAPPKTTEEKFQELLEVQLAAQKKEQESFDAKLAAQKKEFEEKFAALSNTNNNTQRQTQSLGGLNSGNANEFEPEYIYQEGDYLQGKLHPKNWKALANRRVPWPQDVDPNQALFELAPFMVHRMLENEANARGMRVTELAGTLGISPHDDI